MLKATLSVGILVRVFKANLLYAGEKARAQQATHCASMPFCIGHKASFFELVYKLPLTNLWLAALFVIKYVPFACLYPSVGSVSCTQKGQVPAEEFAPNRWKQQLLVCLS